MGVKLVECRFNCNGLLGLTLVKDKEGYAVVKAVENQAKKLGVMKGDKLVSIDNRNVQKLKLNGVLNILKNSRKKCLTIVVSRTVHGLGISNTSWGSHSAVIEVVRSPEAPVPPPPRNTKGIYSVTKVNTLQSSGNPPPPPPKSKKGIYRSSSASSVASKILKFQHVSPASGSASASTAFCSSSSFSSSPFFKSKPNKPVKKWSSSNTLLKTKNVRRSSGSFNNIYRKKSDKCVCIKYRAMYDFQGEQEDELTFKEGDVINFISSIDDNWYKGELRGKQGIFQSDYVEKIEDRRSSWLTDN